MHTFSVLALNEMLISCETPANDLAQRNSVAIDSLDSGGTIRGFIATRSADQLKMLLNDWLTLLGIDPNLFWKNVNPQDIKNKLEQFLESVEGPLAFKDVLRQQLSYYFILEDK